METLSNLGQKAKEMTQGMTGWVSKTGQDINMKTSEKIESTNQKMLERDVQLPNEVHQDVNWKISEEAPNVGQNFGGTDAMLQEGSHSLSQKLQSRPRWRRKP